MREPDRDSQDPNPPPLSYAALFLQFLKFGALAFGGPVAQIAMIRRELVDERRWIDSVRFNRLLAVMQVLPGPEAHELCVHLGMRAKGRLGGLLAGLGFMLPGLALMLLAAWLYSRLPVAGTALGAAFLGVQATVLAVIVRAVHRIGEHILLDRWLWGAALGSATASLAGVSFWIVLPAAGAAHAFATRGRIGPAACVLALAVIAAWLATSTTAVSPALVSTETEPTLAALFFAGLKGGLLTFGGAYTAIPFVRADTVGRGWTTDAEFLDGVGLANMLPAPLVIFATFAGWMSGGLWGALAVTAGMFLPAFAFSLIFYERLEAVLENARLQAFLSGVAAAVVGLIAVTAIQLAQQAAERSPQPAVSAALFLGGLAVVYAWRSKLNAPVVLAAGAGLGVLMLG